MNILLLNQFFWPDAAATSQFLTDLARHLAGEGHNVTVICSRNLYAREDSSNPRPAVRIIRVPGPRFSRGAAGRLASYGAFFAGALWNGWRVATPDIIVSLTTPPLLSMAGTLLKKWRGSRHFIWEMDLFPEALTDLGHIRADSWLSRFIGLIADYARCQSEGVIALGECMRDRLMARGIPADLIYVAENWADGNLIPACSPPPAATLNVLYSGNLGMTHDIGTVAEAMCILKGDPRFHFTFAGSGARRPQLEELCRCEKLENVEFREYCDRNSVGEALAAGHIGLVTQLPCCVGTVVPSKVYGLMAAGRPLLFIGPAHATPALIIRRFSCGWQIDCGDARSLVARLRELHGEPRLIEAAGRRAREAFLAHYDIGHGVSRISAIIGAPRAVPVEARRCSELRHESVN